MPAWHCGQNNLQKRQVLASVKNTPFSGRGESTRQRNPKNSAFDNFDTILQLLFCPQYNNTLVLFTDDGKFGKNIIFYSRRSHLPLICNQVLQSQHTHEKPRYFLIWSKNYWLSLAFRSLFAIYFYTYACQERLCSQNLYPSTIVKQYSISTLHYKFKYLLQKKILFSWLSDMNARRFICRLPTYLQSEFWLE